MQDDPQASNDDDLQRLLDMPDAITTQFDPSNRLKELEKECILYSRKHFFQFAAHYSK